MISATASRIAPLSFFDARDYAAAYLLVIATRLVIWPLSFMMHSAKVSRAKVCEARIRPGRQFL